MKTTLLASNTLDTMITRTANNNNNNNNHKIAHTHTHTKVVSNIVQVLH